MTLFVVLQTSVPRLVSQILLNHCPSRPFAFGVPPKSFVSRPANDHTYIIIHKIVVCCVFVCICLNGILLTTHQSWTQLIHLRLGGLPVRHSFGFPITMTTFDHIRLGGLHRPGTPASAWRLELPWYPGASKVMRSFHGGRQEKEQILLVQAQSPLWSQQQQFTYSSDSNVFNLERTNDQCSDDYGWLRPFTGSCCSLSTCLAFRLV